MAKKEVIVICGDKIVRVSADAFNLVMLAASHMSDGWDDYYRKNGSYSKKQSDAGLEALNKLAGIAL